MPAIGIGRHEVQVVGHVLGRSGTGTPHVAVLFEDINGDRITWYGYLTDKALERTVASLQILGWNPAEHGGDIASLNGTGILAGAEAEVVVEAEEYNGDIQMKVKWVNERGGGLGSGMGADEAATFASDLRAKIMGAAKPQPAKSPGPARQSTGVGGNVDDDLPF